MKEILVACLVGVGITSTSSILNSSKFFKWQKILLAILITFLPAQWILAIIFYFANKTFIDNNIAKQPMFNHSSNSGFNGYNGGHNAQNSKSNYQEKNTNNERANRDKGFNGDLYG